MSLHADKSFEVEKLDNGWVLSWEDKTRNRDLDYMSTQLQRREWPERGREIFTSEKKLVERIKQLL